jgi:hypothetical protein
MMKISPESKNLIKLKAFSSVIDKTKPIVFTNEDSPQKKYFNSKESSLEVIFDGYTTLPPVYQAVYLDSLKKLFSDHFEEIVVNISKNKSDQPFREWLDSIDQRKVGYMISATHAFEECIHDLFDGWLSDEQRTGVKPPDHQTVSSLVRWGAPQDGPYTLPANPEFDTQLGIKMSVISMPPSYSKNIVLWGALAHETGHDIVHADDNLLGEIGDTVMKDILAHEDDPAIKGKQVVYNGRKIPLAKFASSYWKACIDETTCDVLGILNFGPAAAIALATLLIPIRGNELTTLNSVKDVHPIDALRIYLAADLVRELQDLDVTIANTWADSLLSITEKYIKNNDEFKLGIMQGGELLPVATIPFSGMRKTVGIVAQSIAFTNFKSLENHHLSEINTWSNEDEEITVKIANELLDGEEPSFLELYGKIVYPAHVVSGAIVACAQSAEVTTITNNSISWLNKSYDRNPVWAGFSILFRSDLYVHPLVPRYPVTKKETKK